VDTTPQFWLTLIGIIAAIVVPIGLAIHAAGRARSRENVERLDRHIEEDVKAHERLARLETKIDRIEIEQDGIRKRFHDFRDGTMRDAWQLFQDWKSEMVHRFGRERDKDE
jgi:phage shock protein A